MPISIRTFLAVVTAIVGVTAAAIAFAPVYTSALSSVEDVIDNLRKEIGVRLQVNVQLLFSSPQLQISSLMTSAKLGAMNTSDKFSMMPYMGEIAASSGISTYCGFEDGTFLQTDSTDESDIVSVQYTVITTQIINIGTFPYNLTLRSNTSELPAGVPDDYNPTLRPWYPGLFARQSWSQVYLDSSGNFSVLTAGGPFTNSTGLKFGAFAMDFPTTLILSYLQDQTVGKTGRVFLMDRLSGGFLGGNWEVQSFVNVSGELQMAQVSDIAWSDALVSRMFSGLGLDFLKNCTATCRATVGSGNGALFVDVLSVTDSYGLDMRLVVLLPAKDFMDKIDHDSKVSIGATVGAVVGLLILAVIAGQVALSPLSRLEERLYAAASLEDDSEDDEDCNFLSEIVNIESAFSTLRAELARIKSFVPQSVLQKMEDGDEEADEDAIRGFSRSQSESSRRTGASSVSKRQGMMSHGMTQSTDDARTLKSKARSSAASRAREKRGAAVLNVASGLVSRQVTLLVANVIGFHATSAESATACMSQHSEYLNIICAASS
ncbi:membrane-associated protein, putative, partial [Bodo saltans]